jgi:outer membrane protein assembly factor BamE
MFELVRRSVCPPLVALALGAALAGCGNFDRASTQIANVITPYKMDVVQGNVVTREQVAQLKPGMARAQVRDVLGTALLTSVFHADRWEYVFTLQRQGVPPQARTVTVFFKNDAMDRVQADELPSEAEFVATLRSSPPAKANPVMEASAEALSQFPAPVKKPVPAAGAAPVPINYPPLEPAAK